MWKHQKEKHEIVGYPIFLCNVRQSILIPFRFVRMVNSFTLNARTIMLCVFVIQYRNTRVQLLLDGIKYLYAKGKFLFDKLKVLQHIINKAVLYFPCKPHGDDKSI